MGKEVQTKKLPWDPSGRGDKGARFGRGENRGRLEKITSHAKDVFPVLQSFPVGGAFCRCAKLGVFLKSGSGRRGAVVGGGGGGGPFWAGFVSFGENKIGPKSVCLASRTLEVLSRGGRRWSTRKAQRFGRKKRTGLNEWQKRSRKGEYFFFGAAQATSEFPKGLLFLFRTQTQQR